MYIVHVNSCVYMQCIYCLYVYMYCQFDICNLKYSNIYKLMCVYVCSVEEATTEFHCAILHLKMNLECRKRSNLIKMGVYV